MGAAAPPNIILLMSDDHGWEETGYNGHPYVKTPVLDKMAATGLRLDRFYAAHPSCSPTRASVLTGRHPNRYGTFIPGFSLRPEEITIAQILGNAGYARGHFGKWHVGTVKAGSPTNPRAMGFNTWVSHDNFFELNPSFSREGAPPEVHAGESSAVVIDETIRFIESAKDQPFLAVVWFGSPHEPYSGLPEDLALYNDLPEKYADRTVQLTSNETGLQVDRPLGEVLRERYAEITAMDRAIGTLRDYLEANGLRENTVFWYCSDNGLAHSGPLFRPLRGIKGEFYEGGIRVPGIIEWPARISQPRVSDTLAVTSDILPTLCSLTRQPLPDRPLDGMNIAPLIDGSLNDRPQPVYFWDFNFQDELAADPKPWIDPKLQEGTTPLVKLINGIATRNFRNFHHPEIDEEDYSGTRVAMDDRYKLILFGDPEPTRAELYDLVLDPAESRNLAELKPEIVARMADGLRDWQTSVLRSLIGQDYVD